MSDHLRLLSPAKSRRPPGIFRPFSDLKFQLEAETEAHQDLRSRVTALLEKLEAARVRATKPPPPAKILLSQREATQRLGIRREDVARLIREGRLRTVTTGGSRPKIPVEAIDRLIASGDLGPKRRGRPPKPFM